MGYLGNGLTITGTQNSKRIVVEATPNQTISTVTGGYLIGQMDVYRNGVKLVDTQDYTASDGASVTFLSAASEGDELEFVVFENFDVADALSSSGGTVSGDLVVTGIATFNSDVSIGGTLTYEDVTNVDSVGLITARAGVEIGTPGIAATLTAAGGAVFTGVVTASSFSGDITGTASNASGATGDFSIADKIVHTGDTDTAIRFPAADTFTVETAGSEAIRIDSSGNVGIGTDSPSSPLHLTNSNANFRIESTSTTGASAIQFGDPDDIDVGSLRYEHNGNALRFITNASEAMRIDSSGRLLLGLTSGRAVGGATQSLAQIETTSQNGLSFVAHRGTNTSGSILVLGKSRGTSVGSNTIVADGDELGALRFAGADGTDVQSRAASIAAFVDGTPGANDMPGRLTFNTTADGAATPTERMRINSSGLLLVATTSEVSDSEHAKVHIASTGGGALALGRDDSSVTAGNGIGLIRFYGNDGGSYQECARIEVSADGTHANNDKPARMEFHTTADNASSPTERLRIASSGQIGLGGANYGTAGQAIVSNGSGSAPTWQDVVSGVTTHVGTASGIVTSVFLDDATDHKVTVTGFVTFTTTQSGTEGESHTLRIVNSGIATVGFSTYFLFPSGSVPVLPTADGAVSLISFTVHDSVGAGCTQLLAGASLNFSN